MLLAPELDAADQAPAMNSTKPKWLTGAMLLAVVVIAVLVKLFLFPSPRLDDFALNERSLQQVRSGLLVLRPTQFARFHFNGTISTEARVWGKPVQRLLGRNVTFKELVAVAYGQPENRVVLPDNAPKTNFDFLVTVRNDPHEQLQQAIRKQLGFVAVLEPHEAPVLALRVANANLPGLSVSDSGSKEGVEVKDGKICFTHVHIGELTGDLEHQLHVPLVNETGLTNAYNFSLATDAELKMEQELRKGSSPQEVFDEIFKSWGLMLRPDTATLDMLVVKVAD